MAVGQRTVRGGVRTGEVVRAHPSWLALREAADAAARSAELVEELRRHLPTGPLVVHDMGCGTGSMARWLAPRVPGRQHWVLHDRDAELLVQAAADAPRDAADAARVTTETRCDDITRLDTDVLTGASFITASALLDMMSEPELDRLVSSCVGADCPVLVTISVIGRVGIEPADPLDSRLQEAFNAHQRRASGGRRLLGPDAVGVAAAEFTRLGFDVHVRPSPWRLGPAEETLMSRWLAGWVGAAVEREPELLPVADEYLRRRRADAATGRLAVTVHHEDLLALPRASRTNRGGRG
jgi:Methyltransferase domain